MRTIFTRSVTIAFVFLSGGTIHLPGQKLSPPVPHAFTCASVRTIHVSADQISLPTHGAIITSASEKMENGIPYCRVQGRITDVDARTEPILFQVNLPSAWNGKAVQYGGAVFDGSLAYSDGVRRPALARKDIPAPLRNGYATFGSNSGHQSQHFWQPHILSIFNGSFAVNNDERHNFTGASLKKTHDVAVVLMKYAYGMAPQRMFFLGTSTGGHEALWVVQRWPADYDGVMSGYPSWNGMELLLQLARTNEALYHQGGFLPKASTHLLYKQVLATCDKTDGVVDGLVSDIDACHFDPATLLCSVQHRHGCLSEQQLHTVQTFASEQRTTFAGKNGVRSIGGYNVLAGADLTGTLGWFHKPMKHPKVLLNSIGYTITSRAFRYGVLRNNNYDALTTDVVNGGTYVKDLKEISDHYDASDSDLSAFAAHGGKLLLLHGTADAIIPTVSSVDYYKRVQAAMGTEATGRFLKFFLIPGLGHGMGNFLAGIDALGMLDQWNATGDFPANPITVDQRRGHHSRSRPLCAYPAWPKYNGTGDRDLSSSFTCTSPGAN